MNYLQLQKQTHLTQYSDQCSGIVLIELGSSDARVCAIVAQVNIHDLQHSTHHNVSAHINTRVKRMRARSRMTNTSQSSKVHWYWSVNILNSGGISLLWMCQLSIEEERYSSPLFQQLKIKWFSSFKIKKITFLTEKIPFIWPLGGQDKAQSLLDSFFNAFFFTGISAQINTPHKPILYHTNTPEEPIKL